MTEVKRLLVEIPAKMHQEIKTRASQSNVTMRAWVVRAIVAQVKKEKETE